MTTYKGYKVQKTKPGCWYITSKEYGNVMGPFRTRQRAYEYALKIDAVS